MRRTAIHAFESAAPPQLSQPGQHKSRTLSFSYPGNWSIDSTHQYYDPNQNIGIDAPRHGKVLIQYGAFNASTRDVVNAKLEQFDLPGFTIDSQLPFATWGEFSGYGLSIVGKKLGEPYELRVFSYGEPTARLLVTEYRWDAVSGINKDGYSLIARTLRLHNESSSAD